ncbi:MAG: DUF4270 domain-containing protein [Bacteroidales bacterium]|nr:DUF4270 domain-containing protein [Bacteroidales bacterium]MDD4210195.1 DUF4270 domain-containing protein [Bacteroidales bacterium]
MNSKKLVLVCLSMLVFFGCKEEDNIVGLDVQPDSDKLSLLFNDTTSIYAYSLMEDSIPTDETSLSVLGFVSDPVFGKTQAGIYSQFRLAVTALDFGDSAVLDSIVLSLAYDGFFGDTLNPFMVKVYELDESIDIKKTYYNTSSLSYNPTNLTETTNFHVYPKPKSVNPVDSTQKKPVIRIPLSKTYGNEKFIAKSGTSELENNDNFLAYFKGLYVLAEGVSNNGSMVYVDMLDAWSCLTLYYHNKEKKGLKHSFIIKEAAARFTSINHFDYGDAHTSLKKQILDKDYTEVEEKLYVQASGGVKTLLRFPHLKAMFENQKVVINKAELVITRSDDDYSVFFQPPALDMYYKKDSMASTSYYLPDFLIGSDYFGGTYNTNKQEYRFRITQYVQNLIMGDTEDYPLHLVVKGAATKANRMVFYGINPTNDNERRLRLEITYSIIN